MSIEAMKQALEALELAIQNGEFPQGSGILHNLYDTAKSMRQAIAEAEKQEPVVVVPKRLAYDTWAFLAQDCSPCAHEECQIGLQNVGVDTLVDAWNKVLLKEKNNATIIS